MKKSIYCLIILLATFKTFAQTNVYKPFPNTYGDWQLSETDYGGIGSTTYNTLYYVSGDTMVHSQHYKKVSVFNKTQCYCPPNPLNQIFTGGSYNFSYRNDSLNKKVYILLLNDTAEKLWYNFNLNIGDTLKNTYSVQGLYQTPSMIITIGAIDSVSICNNYYKRFTCKCPNPVPFETIYLTESVGFTTNFINQSISDNCQMEPIRLYDTYTWSQDACPNGLLGINNNTTSAAITLYPNPANNSVTIQTVNNQKQNLTIFNINGQQVLQQSINGTGTIDVSSLAPGIYNISLSNNQGIINKRLLIAR